ncbi:MAG: 4-hydroxyphenylacetate decarboxylase small subunit [Pseudomonadota bacterium]
MNTKHKDCLNYLSLDVFKGFCRNNDNANVLADEASCNDFKKTLTCRICAHYTYTDEFLGLCKDKQTAYPDLNAKTCEMFEQKENQ